MPRPLSSDIRRRFQRLYEQGLSGREAASRLLISASSGSRLSRRVKRGESLEPAQGGRKRGTGKLAPHYDFLIEIVTQDPDITLHELRDALEMAEGLRVTVSAIDQALRRLGYSFKKRASSRMNGENHVSGVPVPSGCATASR
jgi:transposase